MFSKSIPRTMTIQGLTFTAITVAENTFTKDLCQSTKREIKVNTRRS